MLSFFRRLQWKISLSYAVVTICSVIVLTAMMVGFAILIESQVDTRIYDSYYWSKTAFQDNIPYLLEDRAALQTWLDRVHEQGFSRKDFQSYTVRESLDYANTLITGAPIYVLDPKLNLLASAPADNSNEYGKPFTITKINGYYIKNVLDSALTGSKDYFSQSLAFSDGVRLAAFPLRQSDDDPVSAIVIYQLKPIDFVTPSHLNIYTQFFVATTIIVLIISLPVGGLFGWLVSRGLRKRLVNLSNASQAWSKGDFSIMPHDTSGDEIGILTRNLTGMTEQLQILLHNRNELARIEERNRIARDLHDTVKQQTYAARMQLSAAKNLIAANPQAAAEHVEAALQLNRETQQELKLIIDELRPAALEGKGLVQALKDYANRWQEHSGIPVTVSTSGERSLPLNVEQVLYRVLQESLSNIARHANAETVQVELSLTPEQAVLSIADDGQGFDPDTISPNSLGIQGMKQRLEEIHGELLVESTRDVGSKVTASVQL
jgi:signal transduction histidine kinase